MKQSKWFNLHALYATCFYWQYLLTLHVLLMSIPIARAEASVHQMVDLLLLMNRA